MAPIAFVASDQLGCEEGNAYDPACEPKTVKGPTLEEILIKVSQNITSSVRVNDTTSRMETVSDEDIASTVRAITKANRDEVLPFGSTPEGSTRSPPTANSPRSPTSTVTST